MSEASKRSSRKRCRDSVRSQRYFLTFSPKSYWSHKSNVTRFPRTERAVFTSVIVDLSTDHPHKSLRRVQVCSGPVRSVRSGGRQQLPKPFKCTAVLWSRESVCVPRAFHRAQFDPPLYNFQSEHFSWNIYFFY